MPRATKPPKVEQAGKFRETAETFWDSLKQGWKNETHANPCINTR